MTELPSLVSGGRAMHLLTVTSRSPATSMSFQCRHGGCPLCAGLHGPSARNNSNVIPGLAVIYTYVAVAGNTPVPLFQVGRTSDDFEANRIWKCSQYAS